MEPTNFTYTEEHSVQLDQLGADLSKLQGELPHVAKDSKGYGYNYSSLSDTLDTVKPLLVTYGFSLTQFEDGTDNLVTMLLHKSGQFIKGRMKLIELEMKSANKAQQKGAVLSYFRRYSIQSILGMAAEDSDGTDKKPDQSFRPSAPKQVSDSPAKESGGDSQPGPKTETVSNSNKKSFRKPTAGSEDNL